MTRSNAYSDQPVILMCWLQDPGQASVLRSRLSSFFDVDESAVRVYGERCLYTFWIRGSYDSGMIPDPFYDGRKFVASASPVYDADVISGPEGSDIDHFARRFAESFDVRRECPPLSLFSADFSSQAGWAANDSFGVGRVYRGSFDGRHGVSNNIAALSILSNSGVAPNREYWDAYYTLGGGVGESTHVEGIYRSLGGRTVYLEDGKLSVTETHSLESQISSAKGEIKDTLKPIHSASRLLEIVKPHFNDRLSVGLSGGRDSRFVTALALTAGLQFTSFTAVPPDLEADVARKLHEASHISFNWEIRDRRRSAGASYGNGSKPNVPRPQTALAERARKWFRFTGGDSWSTFVRQDPKRDGSIRLGALALSGAFGDFARGHYYSADDVKLGREASAVERFLSAPIRVRQTLPLEVRESGVRQLRETFSDMQDRGFHGFRALDMSFLVNRMRRQLPHPAPNTVLPMLTVDLAVQTFWDDPEDRLSGDSLRKMTGLMMPEWSDIPYYHELTAGTDLSVTNKVTIQPTFWEVDQGDFMSTIEYAIVKNGHYSLGMDEVAKYVADLPEGRNRTNVSFEYIVWHLGASELLDEIRKVAVAAPFN